MKGMTKAEFETLVDSQGPFLRWLGFEVDRMEPGDVAVRLPYQDTLARPGGTVAGPAMMALADFAMYVLLLSLNARAVDAVTASLHINFLRRPRQGDIVAASSMLRMGRRLAFFEVSMFTDGEDEPVAHATGTYALPPEAREEV